MRGQDYPIGKNGKKTIDQRASQIANHDNFDLSEYDMERLKSLIKIALSEEQAAIKDLIVERIDKMAVAGLSGFDTWYVRKSEVILEIMNTRVK